MIMSDLELVFEWLTLWAIMAGVAWLFFVVLTKMWESDD